MVNLVRAVTAKPSRSVWSLDLLDSHTALFFMPGGYIPNAITPARAPSGNDWYPAHFPAPYQWGALRPAQNRLRRRVKRHGEDTIFGGLLSK